jgi:hypothetical protein
MTPFLIFVRLAIIGWVWWSMLPFEIACDTIDDELAQGSLARMIIVLIVALIARGRRAHS